MISWVAADLKPEIERFVLHVGEERARRNSMRERDHREKRSQTRDHREWSEEEGLHV